MQKQLLKFGFENAKLKGIWHFSLPSGFTCPAAKDCLTYANRKTGKVKDGSAQDYRCYAAMDEARYPSVRKNRWHNFDLLKGKTGAEMFQTICDSLPVALKKIGGLLRVHIGGDFFNADYFKAWLNAARVYPNITFYAYTKSLHFWEQSIKSIPSNFKLNASRGGKYDEKVEALGLKSAEVFFSEEDAAAANLEIDHDDEHAWKGSESFGLLLHGQQKAGSKASQAQKALRQKGWTGYNHKEKEAALVA